eukprot:1042318-Prymnesium_polylepis.1
MPVAPSAWPSSYTSLAKSWVSAACRLDGLIDAPGRRDGKRALCQVRPARRRMQGWAMPTRS